VKATANMAQAVPNDGISTPSQHGRDRLIRAIARVESVRSRLSLGPDEKMPNGELDQIAAPWFDAGVSAYPKAEAFARACGVDAGYLSHMRKGKVPVALRHIIPFLEHRDSLVAFLGAVAADGGLEPPQPARQLTRADVKNDALEMLVENEALLRLLLEEVARKRGVQREDVLRVLANDE
jgi:hypothetical protein